MTDFIEKFYADKTDDYYADDIDTQTVCRVAIKTVLPSIINNELTERQRDCIKMRYVQNLNQIEIARRLHVSQPTVCRHLNTAKDIINNRLAYCLLSIKKANNMWLQAS